MGPGPLRAVAVASTVPRPELGCLLLQDAAAHHDVDRDVEQAALLHEAHGERALSAEDRRRRHQRGAARHNAQRLPAAQLLPRPASWHPHSLRSCLLLRAMVSFCLLVNHDRPQSRADKERIREGEARGEAAIKAHARGKIVVRRHAPQRRQEERNGLRFGPRQVAARCGDPRRPRAGGFRRSGVGAGAGDPHRAPVLDGLPAVQRDGAREAAREARRGARL